MNIHDAVNVTCFVRYCTMLFKEFRPKGGILVLLVLIINQTGLDFDLIS